METPRLTLDPFGESDKEDYFYCVPHDKKVLETFICKYEGSLEDFNFEPYLKAKDVFAIRLKETGRPIGIILCFDEHGGACEMGYAIGSAYWGRGYAAEAAREFLRYCFRVKGMERVCASYFSGNEASRRVMEKCGMRFERFAQNELEYLGVKRDLTYYAIDRNEFEYGEAKAAKEESDETGI